MKIDFQEKTIKEVFNGYKDSGDDGVVGYGGKLNIRPPYQRNFVYTKPEQYEEVIRTVLKDFPLNIMYWVKTGDDTYEVLDGQQRTLSIMMFLSHKFDIEWNGMRVYWDSLTNDEYDRLMNYTLKIYICEGNDSEKMAWFKIVNIAGEVLTTQELRNITYTGPWLSDAKRYFSKINCVAYQMGSKYITGDPNRQQLLEKVLTWKAQTENKTIDEYMAMHKSDHDADELWQYWQDIINWIQKIFPHYDSTMKGIDWGTLYNKYSMNHYNSSEMSEQVNKLMEDEDVSKKSGIYVYLLAKDYETGATRYLSIRDFDIRDKKIAYSRQHGICPYCVKDGGANATKVWAFNEMDGDHITPWSKGGKTELDNLQMLCGPHNKQYGNIG